ncbi:Clp protease N-terminal domain-containing protein [Actinoplanes teichomyceticus]|uniref:ClpA/ClpB-like protein n=1 Tax=Actinoplanes teichomyceticus TaxID=1867 RepID=A0A561VRM7_ACTTI|nr:Clp protease N-terminal domain-containing protein [Actinoplanes teichomyceticus]TWG14279.1 ClpA/ClpB-like protein [Actinoplanes teichomyceticus]GIF13164.1 Clp protease [Actinoplanes teichomyceticus]
MFERFTQGARAVVTGAQDQARTLGHPVIDTEHLLLALLTVDSGAAAVLRDAGIDRQAVRAAVVRQVGDLGDEAAAAADRDAEDAAALRAIGIDLAAVRAAIEENFGAGALHLPRPARKRRGILGRFHATTGRIPFSGRNKKVLELSLREALRLKHRFIAPEHILLGMLREGQGLAMRILTDRGVDFTRMRDELARSLETRPVG